jgi:hypothetical protein
MPRFTLALDKSTGRANRILQVLDEIGVPEPEKTDEESEKEQN